MLSPAQPPDVPQAFDEGASTYDLMVGLNPGYHAHLRSAARALVASLPVVRGRGELSIADLGCGSGASTRALVRSLDEFGQGYSVVGLDASASMLVQAQAKVWPEAVSFVHGKAEDLARCRADWGLAKPLDGVFAAYLFRNLSDRGSVLAAVENLLAPGGVLVVHEYSIAGSRRASAVWTAVCWLVVIPLAWITSRRTRLYRYLWRSVQTFDSVAEFTDRLHRAGFTAVEVRTVSGWQHGILHTFRARKIGGS